MGTNPSSQMPGKEELQAIAAAIFARHGVEVDTVRRAGGWTNAVWLSQGLVLRLSTGKGNLSLLREARLARLLPPGAGYPRIVETGTSDGFCWSLVERLPGESLGNAWGGLGAGQRVTALQGLWERAQAVHSVPGFKAAGIAARESWFNSTDPERAEAGLAWLEGDKILTTRESRVLRGSLARYWRVRPAAPCVLCHGDLTMDNAVWLAPVVSGHNGQVIGLLDFEFAVMAPVQLDLNHLVKCAYGPGKGEPALRRTVKDMARPLLRREQDRVLLAGYAVLLELWLLVDWLEHPEGEDPLEQWEPLRRLRSLAEERQGYLGEVRS
jgi:aminoglycoside phosphotransferase (APT) family kinase protein